MSYPNTDSVEHLTMYMTIMTNIAVRHVLTGTIKIAHEMTQHEETAVLLIKSRRGGQEATTHDYCP